MHLLFIFIFAPFNALWIFLAVWLLSVFLFFPSVYLYFYLFRTQYLFDPNIVFMFSSTFQNIIMLSINGCLAVASCRFHNSYPFSGYKAWSFWNITVAHTSHKADKVKDFETLKANISLNHQEHIRSKLMRENINPKFFHI